MQITLNIPDGHAGQIVDGICEATGWTAGSGLTKAAWAKAEVVKFVKTTAKRGQVRQSMTTIAAAIDPLSIT